MWLMAWMVINLFYQMSRIVLNTGYLLFLFSMETHMVSIRYDVGIEGNRLKCKKLKILFYNKIPTIRRPLNFSTIDFLYM